MLEFISTSCTLPLVTHNQMELIELLFYFIIKQLPSLYGLMITKFKYIPMPAVYNYRVFTDLVSWWILDRLPLNGPAGINPFIDVALGNTDGCSALQCISAV